MRRWMIRVGSGMVCLVAGWFGELAVSGWDVVGWGPLIGGVVGVFASEVYLRWTSDKASFWQFYQKIMPILLKTTIEATADAKQPRAAFQPEQRVYTRRTVAEIFAAIENMTNLQIDKFAEPHIGKWIRVQSVVRDINQNDKFFYVMLGKWFDPVPYLCFQKVRWPQIETMVQGDPIAAEGQIYKIEKMTLYLDRCELVEPQEKDDVLRPPKRPNHGTSAT